MITEARAHSAALGLYLWLIVITGQRRGELCGIQIRDVDLDQGLIHVAFNYVVKGGKKICKDTKTHQDRWLAIDPDTCALIANYLAETRAARAAVGAELAATVYLFSNGAATSLSRLTSNAAAAQRHDGDSSETSREWWLKTESDPGGDAAGVAVLRVTRYEHVAPLPGS